MTNEPAATRVDFYVLESADDRTRLNYACRLVEKAYLAGQTLYVRVDDAAAADELDGYLWTFAEQSFVPHALAGTDTGDAPVTIGVGMPDTGRFSMLVNLASDAPDEFLQFTRVAEFVDAEAGRREKGRRRFQFYRERGVKANTHNVGADAQRA